MNGNAEAIDVETGGEQALPDDVAEEHRASREIGGMAVFHEPNGSQYGSAGDGDDQEADNEEDPPRDEDEPTEAMLLERNKLLEEQVDGASEAMSTLKAKMKQMAASKDRGKFCAICVLSIALFGLTALVLYT